LENPDLTLWESILVKLWPVWWLISKIFIIPLIALGIGYLFWATVRTIKKLKADIDAYPGIAAMEFFGILAGLVYIVPQVSYY
jgi:hypothetical protein